MSQPHRTQPAQRKIILQLTAFLLIMASSLGLYVAVASSLPLMIWVLFFLVAIAMGISACTG